MINDLFEDFGSVKDQKRQSNAGARASDADSGSNDMYEKGYKAGWEDALSRHKTEQDQIETEVLRAIRDAEFSFQEARFSLLEALKPVFERVITHMLPDLAMNSLGPSLLEELNKMTENAIDVPIEIVTSETARMKVSDLFRQAGMNLDVSVEPSLADGQAFVRAGKKEVFVDMATITSRLEEGFQALLTTDEKAIGNG